MRPCRDNAHVRIFKGLLKNWNIIAANDSSKARGLGHLVQVPQQPETGNIRAGMNGQLLLPDQFGRQPVQGRHHLDNRGFNTCCRKPPLQGGGKYPGPERFGQDQNIPNLCPGIKQDLVRMDDAGHRQAVFQLIIFNGMAADQQGAGLPDLGKTTFNDLPENMVLHGFHRTGKNIHA